MTPNTEVRELEAGRARLRNVWSEAEHWQTVDTVVLGSVAARMISSITPSPAASESAT